MSGNPKIHHCLKVNILAKRWVTYCLLFFLEKYDIRVIPIFGEKVFNVPTVLGLFQVGSADIFVCQTGSSPRKDKNLNF